MVAKKAIKAIATINPNISKEVFSRAIAATATTLSIDIDTSAIVMVISALINWLLSLPVTWILFTFSDLSFELCCLNSIKKR